MFTVAINQKKARVERCPVLWLARERTQPKRHACEMVISKGPALCSTPYKDRSYSSSVAMDQFSLSQGRAAHDVFKPDGLELFAEQGVHQIAFSLYLRFEFGHAGGDVAGQVGIAAADAQ